MPEIHILDNSTIDKIAAGEVVERPASVVKELVENAMDAGARAVTVEIKEGGIEFIRVTDDGSGIEKPQVKNAFLRHATSKISNISDLLSLQSMGFRGEALSSIAAVSKVELITKTKNDMTGIRYCLEGAKETEYEEIGAPDGTTFIVRNLFFNTPARRKFLKTAMTEGSYVTDLLEHMALARPEISFKYIINGQTKFFTNGDDDMRAIIYRIFGRDIANEMMEFQMSDNGISIKGFLGKPVLNRANRNFENYFVNNRYIKSKIISKALEEGYQSYMMQHRYPFCVVHITVPPDSVDVNVHPTKMEVRFSNQTELYKIIAEGISDFLAGQEMIPAATLGKDNKADRDKKGKNEKIPSAPEPFEKERRLSEAVNASERIINMLKEDNNYGKPGYSQFTQQNHTHSSNDRIGQSNKNNGNFFADNRANKSTQTTQLHQSTQPGITTPQGILPPQDIPVQYGMGTPIVNKIIGGESRPENPAKNVIKASEQVFIEKPEQLNFFDEKLLTREARQEYRIVGQVFDTYWIIEYRDKLLVIDQHAAHEKVKYEQILKKVQDNEIYTQTLTPPVVINVTPREAGLIKEYEKYFAELGFVIEDFGMNSYAIRGVPLDLFSYNIKELFEEIVTQMSESPIKGVPDIIREKIASMACKAAVKGNNSLSYEEMDTLIEQLLELDNPYNCPHGRPTIISMSKYEIEKKFKRVL